MHTSPRHEQPPWTAGAQSVQLQQTCILDFLQPRNLGLFGLDRGVVELFPGVKVFLVPGVQDDVGDDGVQECERGPTHVLVRQFWLLRELHDGHAGVCHPAHLRAHNERHPCALRPQRVVQCRGSSVQALHLSVVRRTTHAGSTRQNLQSRRCKPVRQTNTLHRTQAQETSNEKNGRVLV
jgi:hypothetical protein